MSFAETLRGRLILAPMTKGSNLPYRRLCMELGAKVLVSEMVVAREDMRRRMTEESLREEEPQMEDTVLAPGVSSGLNRRA